MNGFATLPVLLGGRRSTRCSVHVWAFASATRSRTSATAARSPSCSRRRSRRPARAGEAAGFDTVLVMDHFYQLPGIGSPDQPMLEATALGALATATERIQLSTLVDLRPTLLAKAVTTLDVVSGGRAVLGIGAGGELEHRQLGFEFGTFTDRFNRLDEALQIIAPMLRGERPSLEGAWYRAENAINEPRSATTCRSCWAVAGRRRRSGWPPASPTTSTSSATPPTCPASWTPSTSAAPRPADRATLETSSLVFAMVDEDGDRARPDPGDYLRGLGPTRTRCPTMSSAPPPRGTSSAPPDDVAADLQRRILDPGWTGSSSTWCRTATSPAWSRWWARCWQGLRGGGGRGAGRSTRLAHRAPEQVPGQVAGVRDRGAAHQAGLAGALVDVRRAGRTGRRPCRAAAGRARAAASRSSPAEPVVEQVDRCRPTARPSTRVSRPGSCGSRPCRNSASAR